MSEANLTKLTLERLRRGVLLVRVYGVPNTRARLILIEEAIGILQTGGERLRREYLGIKNYAHFGDQRADHSYYMGPKHGTIVFRIVMPEQRRADERALTPDEVDDAVTYLLAERDFAPFLREVVENGYRTKVLYNLADCLLEHQRAVDSMGLWRKALSAVVGDDQRAYLDLAEDKR